jgi:hypothetical protein
MKADKKHIVIAGLIALFLIAAFPFYYDTDDALDPIVQEHGHDFGTRIRATTPECTDDGIGTGHVPFGTNVFYCGTSWFILFNMFPFQIRGGEIPREVPLGGSAHDARHWSEAFNLSIAYPNGVHLLTDEADRLTFSLLSPNDPRRQSSVGLLSNLTISPYEEDEEPADAIPVTISLHDNPHGIRALASETIGAYGGELHRTYYFRDYGVRVHYVVTPDTEPTFEQMIRSLQFNSLPHVTLTDGEETIAGTFHDSTSLNGLKSFHSDEMGISLQYPDDHLLFTSTRFISIMPEESILSAIARIQSGAGGGEGPPGILFSFFEAGNSVSLEAWVRTDSRSNWKLALPPWEEQENTLTPTTVAGVPAFAYHNEGLYSFDYVAFTYGDWIVLASGASGDGTSNQDFQAILNSIQLQAHAQ